MKKAILALAVISLVTLGCSSAERGAKKDAGIDARVRKLLAKMTVEEKVGQMTQITLDPFARSGKEGYLILDDDKLREGIVNHHIGSILNCAGQARTVQNWQEIITRIQDIATKETRLGIPIIYGIDSIHGTNYVLGSTIFPQNIAMGATGNVDLMAEHGAITAYETRAAGIPWNFNPVLGLARQPMWSRVFETFGEDPHIASVMGAAYIRAQQGDDLSDVTKVATCMKHYLGYSVPHSGRDRTPAYISERQLRQIFLKPFAAAVEAGTATCMVNSSEINGVPVHAGPFYLKDMLRDELGFKGFVVSDWADIENLYTREMVAKDRREAVKMAVMAGVDMSMVPYDYSFSDTLVELVNAGEVPMKRIDEAVADILAVKFKLGLFERPYPVKSMAGDVGSDANAEVNLQAAQEALTLLKNDEETLPLAKDRRILVTGPSANKLSLLNSGWTLTWQGDKEELYPQDKHTILEAIQAKVGEDRVTYVEGAAFDKEIDIVAAVTAAQDADAIVACIGEPTYCETPGNIDDLALTAPQLKLVEALVQTGKPVVLVLVEGRPRVIRTIVDDAQAILLAYLPGMEGGRAVADVLFGDVNPSGKLPYTYPKFAGGFTTYDYKTSEEKATKGLNQQWPFGHGLSYATFAYHGLRSDKSVLTPGEKLAVTVEVENQSERAGKEIV
ncbi:MAG: glycoside hydrolase family 3 N-terminal domain-containing protein, partial [Planctomycetota bacterium]